MVAPHGDSLFTINKVMPIDKVDDEVDVTQKVIFFVMYSFFFFKKLTITFFP